MSKKLSQENKTPAPSRRKRLVTVITLALICIIGTSLVAQVTSRRKGKRASGDVSAMSFSAASPSKEYIYAGSKLISTIEPTAVNGNDAQFVSMSYLEPCSNLGWLNSFLPFGPGCFGVPGQEYTVRVTMKNTGSVTWTSGNYCLGSQNPSDNLTWGLSSGLSRVPLTSIQSGTQTPPIAPNQQITFEFTAKRPGTGSGPFNFQWRMVQGPVSGGGVFFGEKTTNVAFPGNAVWLCEGAPGSYAAFVTQSVPSQMYAGQSYSVSVTMNNAGTVTWTAAGGYKLGSQSPQDNTYWGTNRIALPSSVAPGANATFSFNLTAPSTAGTYIFQWAMVQDGGMGWFGYLSQSVSVNVIPPPPVAPSNLFVFTPPAGSTQMMMTWTDNSNSEDGFKIERLDGNSGWVQVATVGVNVISYTDTGLSLDTQYCYRVRAYNASGGNSAYSSQSCAWTSSGGD